tara:strand:- start:290 stop:397 length:108 start_codon:yes stop_codon:yes gene_type:complete
MNQPEDIDEIIIEKIGNLNDLEKTNPADTLKLWIK